MKEDSIMVKAAQMWSRISTVWAFSE